MAQSVELIFDPATEAALRDHWDRLADNGLPSSRRADPDPDHRPHLTLYAADRIAAAADARLPDLFGDLDLPVRIGALMIFGPRRGQVILVRQVIPSAELLSLQQQVANVCRADRRGQFAAGHWSPHVTLARRMGLHQLGAAVEVLGGSAAELTGVVRHCRRWDGARRKVLWSTESPAGH
jgi:2'-5' RNA ligase